MSLSRFKYISLFSFFCIICYAKSFFLYDEELVIVSCILIVFFSLNFILSNNIKNTFEKQLTTLRGNYIEKVLLEKGHFQNARKKFDIIEASFMNLGCFLLFLRSDFSKYLAFNNCFLDIFIKFFAWESLVVLAVAEIDYEKDLNLFLIDSVLESAKKFSIKKIEKDSTFF